MKELLSRLRNHSGMFCIAGKDTGEYQLPPELSIHERLQVPDREQQKMYWLQLLPGMDQAETELSRIIDSYPLHMAEIDFIVRQAAILATIRRLEEHPSIADLHEVLEKHKGKAKIPLLFGEQ